MLDPSFCRPDDMSTLDDTSRFNHFFSFFTGESISISALKKFIFVFRCATFTFTFTNEFLEFLKSKFIWREERQDVARSNEGEKCGAINFVGWYKINLL